MKEHQRTGFIGAGNMTTAMIKGLLQSGAYQKDQLLASDKDEKAVNRISDQFGVRTYGSNVQLVRECATVVLAVKPQNVREVLEEVKGDMRDDHLAISIAAGIPLKMIRDLLGRDIPLIRVMPNTPALVLMGASALAGGGHVKREHMAIARKIFDAVGETVEVEESMMDAVTALSGSGPGYVFRIMECMVEAGFAAGLPRDIAHRLVLQTFLGAAHLAKNSRESLTRLREMVTSPGGTTAAGLAVFDQMGLKEMVRKAVEAAHRRGQELAKG